MDDELTWTTVYTQGQSYDTNGYVGPIAIDPRDPSRVYAGYTSDRHEGDLVGSTNGGRTWSTVQAEFVPYTSPMAVAFDPLDPSDARVLWFGLGFYHSEDAGHTWHKLDLHLPPDAEAVALDVDPLTGRAYSLHQRDPGSE